MLLISILAANLAHAAPDPWPQIGDTAPQPQFSRQDWLSLNGTWNFACDDQDEGLSLNWPTGQIGNQGGQHKLVTASAARTIQVPFTFEAPASGIHDLIEHNLTWYQRNFSVPKKWHGRRVLLHFGAAYHTATVWLNGIRLGEHAGGQTPFSFDLGQALRPATNVITVRVSHPAGDLLLARGKQSFRSDSWSIFYARTSGIWQSVWLEAVGDNYMESAHFSTELTGLTQAKIKFHEIASQLRIEASVVDSTGRHWEMSKVLSEDEGLAREAKLNVQVPALV